MTKRRLKRIRIARNAAIRSMAQSGVDIGSRVVQFPKPRALAWRLAFFTMESK